MTTSPNLTFPHATLTAITGEPTAASLALLRKELYANAAAIPSTNGGPHGHLAIIMAPAAYSAIPNVIPLPVPPAPGPLPVHPAGATGPQITEANRQHDFAAQQFSTYSQVAAALKSQVLQAVNPTYVRALEHTDFGYSFVTSLQLLQHLQDTYGTVTDVDLDRNREALCAPWAPDDNIEALWQRIDTCQRLATTGNEPITDTTAIRLVLAVLEKTGVFTYALDTWRNKPTADHNMANFRQHFRLENVERIRKATATSTGFHSANSATGAPATPKPPPARPTPPNNTSETVFVDGTDSRLYYCWTHGLGFSKNHTSASCTTRADGHVATATFKNPAGGSNKVTMNTPRSRRAPRPPAAT